MSRRFVKHEEFTNEKWIEVSFVETEGNDLIFEIVEGRFDGRFLKISLELMQALIESKGWRIRYNGE